MKILLVITCVALTGCAYLTSRTTSGTDPKTGIVSVETKVRCYTLFDSEAALAKFSNRGQLTQSNQWAPGTTIGTLNQSATSTNLNDIIGTVVGAAVKAAVKP